MDSDEMEEGGNERAVTDEERRRIRVARQKGYEK